ncbi:uncharacterized protein LOC133806602 [Humulus lupulus]|uniref:uncharacterized protein LOC133806602 n=1 Tax=Humulus lupulus TaxID=3486 RepID=UPI002B410416|nr:uncharacterized protein LOC133806602 [Humulus lupulus]
MVTQGFYVGRWRRHQYSEYYNFFDCLRYPSKDRRVMPAANLAMSSLPLAVGGFDPIELKRVVRVNQELSAMCVKYYLTLEGTNNIFYEAEVLVCFKGIDCYDPHCMVLNFVRPALFYPEIDEDLLREYDAPDELADESGESDIEPDPSYYEAPGPDDDFDDEDEYDFDDEDEDDNADDYDGRYELTAVTACLQLAKFSTYLRTSHMRFSDRVNFFKTMDIAEIFSPALQKTQRVGHVIGLPREFFAKLKEAKNYFAAHPVEVEVAKRLSILDFFGNLGFWLILGALVRSIVLHLKVHGIVAIAEIYSPALEKIQWVEGRLLPLSREWYTKLMKKNVDVAAYSREISMLPAVLGLLVKLVFPLILGALLSRSLGSNTRRYDDDAHSRGERGEVQRTRLKLLKYQLDCFGSRIETSLDPALLLWPGRIEWKIVLPALQKSGPIPRTNLSVHPRR